MSIESPCILVCVLDPKSGYCFGCGRTGEEIASWTSVSPETRRAVTEVLPSRLANVERPARRETARSRRARERREMDAGSDA
ncbi:DUF1289 domain-containing protein [Aurantimonas marina]|uniref:DUF1289 domain-containing protein n=1 Tax=Aurantimonas marina TaxID=2780508 RepID=UPI0019D14AA6|nr:DUF1289 domain-containing protein [Aurantimonas marina]